MGSVTTTRTSLIDRLPPWVGRILTPERRRFIKFIIVGGSGVFVNLGVVALCERFLFTGLGERTIGPLGEVNLTVLLALVAGILVSIFTNFLINDNWTWRDRAKEDGIRGWIFRCLEYYVTNGVAGGLQFATAWAVWATGVFNFSILSVDLSQFEATLASLVGIVVATPLNYVINNVWTFRDRD